MTDRYADKFLNALMYSHQIWIRAELWYGQPAAWVAALNIANGSINGERSGSVRRTATITVDPGALKLPHFEPYGARLKLFRGIVYPGGGVEEVQVFYGRIEAIESSLDGVTVRASDLAADIMDARFLVSPMSPGALPGAPTKILDAIKALILDVHPGIAFDTTGIKPESNIALAPGTNWSQERGDALDSLCTQLQGGCEWFIDMNGVANIRPLPAVLPLGTAPVWVIDSGDEGVLIERSSTVDRQNVYNGAVVFGEAVGGDTGATNHWEDDRPGSLTHWDGPFGHSVQYYNGQQVNTTQAALDLAKNMVLNSISAIRSLNVTCVANPKLQLGAVVRVFSARAEIDGVFYVQSLTLPMEPETAMTLTVNSALEASGTSYRDAELRIPEGAVWQPGR